MGTHKKRIAENLRELNVIAITAGDTLVNATAF